ncbi:MAG TPA: hypothetical protein VLS49_15935 [Usitatibacter sp.]|nr:hypothetical protein [Usitatibacter sp.]
MPRAPRTTAAATSPSAIPPEAQPAIRTTAPATREPPQRPGRPTEPDASPSPPERHVIGREPQRPQPQAHEAATSAAPPPHVEPPPEPAKPPLQLATSLPSPSPATAPEAPAAKPQAVVPAAPQPAPPQVAAAAPAPPQVAAVAPAPAQGTAVAPAPASVPAPSPAAVASPVAAPPGITDNDLVALVAQLSSLYQKGDLESFLALFADDARIEQGGKDRIREDYGDLFQSTAARQLYIWDMKWAPDAGGIYRGKGNFQAKVVRKGEDQARVYNGTIRLEAVRVNGAARLRGMFH